jgi:hypothetical protein
VPLGVALAHRLNEKVPKRSYVVLMVTAAVVLLVGR